MSSSPNPPFKVSVNRVKGPGGGLGNISIVARKPGNELGKGAIERLMADVSAGKYIVGVESPDIGQCGDGRPGDFTAAKMFGGTPALVRDDAVSENNRFAADDGVVAAQKRMYAWRRKRAKRNISHGDDHSPCGCGECAQAHVAAETLVVQPDLVFQLTQTYFAATGLGAANRNLFDQNIARTRQLLASGFYEDGVKQLEAFRQSAHTADGDFEIVRGGHKEAVWMVLINSTGMALTLDRDAIAGDYEPDNLQAFVENHTEIVQELEDMSVRPEAKQRLLIANVARRLSTAAVLTDLSLEIGFVQVET